MKWLYLVLIVLTLLLFIGGPGYYSDPVTKELWDTGHALLFAAAVFVLMRQPRFKRKSLWVSVCLSTLFCMVIGLATEILQIPAGRDFEIKDLGNDLLGGYVGWAIAVATDKSNRKSIRISLLPAVLLILFFVFAPVYRAGFNALMIQRQFPVLSDFETPCELDRWNAKPASMALDTGRVRHGEKALRIDLQPGIWPGFSLETFRRDWRGYTVLHFSLYNTTAHTLAINLKIYDRKHVEGGYEYRDRFNRGLTLMPGWNDIHVPLADIQAAPQDRKMDLSNIFSFSLFLSRLDAPMTLYFDNLRLSRE
jgi:VanZ family protein